MPKFFNIPPPVLDKKKQLKSKGIKKSKNEGLNHSVDYGIDLGSAGKDKNHVDDHIEIQEVPMIFSERNHLS